jgi:hypothetical protein
MMSALANVETYMPSLRPLHGAIRNIEGRADELIELDAHEFWRLQGDNRWRMIVYVLEPGEILVVTQRGDVLVEALSTASVVVTPSLKGAPYKGPYLVFA